MHSFLEALKTTFLFHVTNYRTSQTAFPNDNSTTLDKNHECFIYIVVLYITSTEDRAPFTFPEQSDFSLTASYIRRLREEISLYLSSFIEPDGWLVKNRKWGVGRGREKS